MQASDYVRVLAAYFLDHLEARPLQDGYLISLPFDNAEGEQIEVAVTSRTGSLVVDDLEQTAGLLFSLGQHAKGEPGHQFIKRLAQDHGITMDYDHGLLVKDLPTPFDPKAFLEFVRVILAGQMAVPLLRQARDDVRRSTRLGTQLGRDIRQLRWRDRVQKRADVQGRAGKWIVEYKYLAATEHTDVCIVAADLTVSQPLQKAEHAITLATDVLKGKEHPTIRVVYELNGSGKGTPARAAANLLTAYQEEIGYQTYNYSEPRDKDALKSITASELIPPMIV